LLRRRSLHIRGLLSAIVIAFALQLSGLAHAVADALAFSDHELHEDADCSEGGSECPPGCPDCHCSHMGGPAVIPAFAQAIAFATSIVFGGSHHTPPPQPAIDQPYRPPRV
jgi:hypothetical protein